MKGCVLLSLQTTSNGGVNGLYPTTFSATTLDNKYYSFTEPNQLIKYNLAKVNSNLTSGYLLGKEFSKEEFDEEFETHKNILLWIKPKSSFNQTNILRLSSHKTLNTGNEVILFTNADGEISLLEKENGVDRQTITLDNKLNLNAWNMIFVEVQNKQVFLYAN